MGPGKCKSIFKDLGNPQSLRPADVCRILSAFLIVTDRSLEWLEFCRFSGVQGVQGVQGVLLATN